MLPNPLVKSFFLTLMVTISFVLCLEMYWRGRGFIPSHNDDKVLWATKRKELDKLKNNVTLFVGGSRIKFDLDIPTWERLTEEKAIQLALVGTPARTVLRHLANDENFKGNLIIDVAEVQFFSFVDSLQRDKSAREAIEYYLKESPAQSGSAYINFFLESGFVLLEEGKFSLNALLSDIKIPNRPGIFVRPAFPKEFAMSSSERQNIMTPMFVSNPELQKIQSDNWMKMGRAGSTIPPIKGDTLRIFFEQIKSAIDKIRSRGGQIVFVRPPSNGDILEIEKVKFPRQHYWDVLLEYTKTPGIHYADYPETADLICPELSHLAPKDAIVYTSELIKILQNEKDWKFSSNSASTSFNPNLKK